MGKKSRSFGIAVVAAVAGWATWRHTHSAAERGAGVRSLPPHPSVALEVAMESPSQTPIDPLASGNDGATRVLLALYTTATSEPRALAQVSTFADNDTVFVGHSPSLASQEGVTVLDLGAEMEEGGHPMLYRKTLRLMHHLANRSNGYIDRYDWFMKADDDTYVHLPRLKWLLRHLDPSVPLLLGSSRFGMATGMSTQLPLSKMLRKGEFFREMGYYSMCHGGAGYVVSRGLLALLEKKLRRCEVEPPPTHMEDAKLAFCANQHTGVQCLGLQGDAGFDQLRNAQRGAVSASRAAKLASTDPSSYAAGTTFHKVGPKLMREIHSRIRALENDPLVVDGVRARSARVFEDRVKFVRTWNCSVDVGQVTHSAVCQRCALRSPGPRPVSIVVKGRPTWEVLGAESSGPGASVNPLTNAVLILVSATDAVSNNVARLVESLHALGSDATVVAVVTSHATGLEVEAATRAHTNITVIGPGGMETEEANGKRRGGQVKSGESPDAEEVELPRLFSVAAGYLLDNAHRFRKALLCPPQTTFATDPFARWIGHALARNHTTASRATHHGGAQPLQNTLPHQQGNGKGEQHEGLESDSDQREPTGLLAFMTERPPPLLTASPSSKVLVRAVFGVCSESEAAKTPKWIGPGLVDPRILAGTPVALAGAMAAAVVRHHEAHSVAGRECTLAQAYSRVIWSGQAALADPATVFTPTASPVRREDAVGKQGAGAYTVGG
eukprot:m.236063 g.236063  ORF g.236063 m.236063 type:complete len:726 (-) comp15771_c0_seq3:109-2286(-)